MKTKNQNKDIIEALFWLLLLDHLLLTFHLISFQK